MRPSSTLKQPTCLEALKAMVGYHSTGFKVKST